MLDNPHASRSLPIAVRPVLATAVLLAASWTAAAQAVGTVSNPPVSTPDQTFPAAAVTLPSAHAEDLSTSPLSLPSTRARDLFEKAVILAQDKNYRDAIPLFEEVMRLDPAMKATWESLGWSYWRVGRENDAIALWERLRIIDPSQPLAYNLLAKAATARGDFAGAMELNQRSLELQPNQFAVKYAQARILLWRGQTETGIAMLTTALQEDPNRFDIMRELAQALLQLWRYEQALPLWRKLSEQSSDNPDYLAMEGLCLLHGNQPDSARAIFDKVLALKPDHPVALEGMASLEEFGSEPAKAATYLRRLILAQADPNEKENVRVRLINLLVRLHRADPLSYTLNEPLDLVKDRLEYNPKSVDALLLRGELLLLDLKYAAAEEQFIVVLEKFNAHNIRARRDLFETYIASKRFDHAREQLDALRKFNPCDPYLDYYLSRLEAIQSRFSAAYAALDRLEAAGQRGAVAGVLYHGLTPSRYFTSALAESRFREHLEAMRNAGFQFVKASDIPALFAATTNETSLIQPRTATAPPPTPSSDVAPVVQAPATSAIPIQVCISFDDGRKDSMSLGTVIARDFGLIFSQNIPCGDITTSNSFIVTWEQLENYVASGYWDIGSHFDRASFMILTEPSGRPGHALPNLTLLKDLGRMETPDEYVVRLKREFADSQTMLRQHTGQRVNFIAYPYGDIGQELDTNLQDPVPAILETGRACYEVGFIQSSFGFAVAGDDPMLYQRHEMDRWMSGSNVVEYLYAHHPIFLARRTRAEYAALDGKQYRAMENVEWLKKNGYPSALLEQASRYVETTLPGGYVRPADAPAAKKSAWALSSIKPRLHGEGEYFSDNQDRTNWRLYGGGGINAGERLAMDAKAGVGQLTQKTVAISSNGVPVTPSRQVTVDEVSAGVRGTLLFVSDPTHPLTDYYPQYISAGFMQRQFSGDANDAVTAFDAETQLRPILSLDVMLRFERDIAPSALAVVDNITYDAWMLNGLYRLRDWWSLNGSGIWYSFSDDNTRDHLSIASSWLLHERSGFWAGLRYYYANADQDSNAYWTPYQLNRYSVEGQFRGSYLRAYYNFKVNYGYGKEDVRPEEMLRYTETQARARKQGWVFTDAPPFNDWAPLFGASASMRIRLQDHWSLNGEISYTENPDYNEISAIGGVTCAF